MEKKPVVKARLHHGTKSFDITIPTAIVQSFKINEGDIFSVEVIKNDDIEIIYKRIFKQK